MTINERLHQYALLIRWDKPVGTLLLLWPTLAALTIASNGRPTALVLFVFICGVFLIRAAGCILNDIADRNIDHAIARTKERPLATGKISVIEALALCALLLFIAFVLVLQLNTLTIILAVIGVVLAAIYPLTKRWISAPQVCLGLAFNWGIPMAFAAETGHIPFVAWLFYVIAIIWTVGYDTMYAMVDREDDLKMGIKSTAILFAQNDRMIIAALQLSTTLLLLLLVLILHSNFWAYLGILVTALLFGYQQFLIKDRKPELCFKAFLNNHWAWMVFFLGIYLSYAR